MTETNWDMVKFQYEILGMSLEELSKEHDLSLPLLKFSAENWKPLPAAQQKVLQFPDTSSLEKITKDLTKQVREEVRTASVIKQRFLSKKYISLEIQLLTKANQVLANLDPKEKSAANSIRTITEVLRALLEQNSLLHVTSEREDFDEGGTPTKWEIVFVDAKDDKPEITGSEET